MLPVFSTSSQFKRAAIYLSSAGALVEEQEVSGKELIEMIEEVRMLEQSRVKLQQRIRVGVKFDWDGQVRCLRFIQTLPVQ